MPSFSMPSPIGHLTIDEEDEKIVAINWASRPAGNGSPLLAEAARQLQAYFAGKLSRFAPGNKTGMTRNRCGLSQTRRLIAKRISSVCHRPNPSRPTNTAQSQQWRV